MSGAIKNYREEITEQIIKAIESGTAPWQKPWDGRACPCNAISKRQYTGINTVVLTMRGIEIDGGHDPRWATFLQANNNGWKIKKGSKGTRVILWKPIEDEESKEEKPRIIQRIFTVFHATQIEGIPAYEPPAMNEMEICEKAEQIITGSGAEIHYGGDRACYYLEKDIIEIPEREGFYSTAGYYSTLLHELVHWTGHSSRMKREMSAYKHSEKYAREELVAEIGSMFISAATGIPQCKDDFENNTSYINSWLREIDDKSNAIFKAVAEANKAADFLLKCGNVSVQPDIAA